MVVAVAAVGLAAAATTVPTSTRRLSRHARRRWQGCGRKTLHVTGDKDVPMTDAERKTWHDTTLNLHDLRRVANHAAEAVTTLATQLTAAEAGEVGVECASSGEIGADRREHEACRSCGAGWG